MLKRTPVVRCPISWSTFWIGAVAITAAAFTEVTTLPIARRWLQLIDRLDASLLRALRAVTSPIRADARIDLIAAWPEGRR